MTTLSSTRVGIALLAGACLAATGLPGASAAQATSDRVPELVDQIFAGVPPSDHMSVVFKDDRERAYLAFYLSTYADVKELRTYSVSYLNVREYVADVGDLDALLADGKYAEVFDGLLGIMRIDLGSKYVSDVGLDGVRDAPVPVGTGTMRDRFHAQVFANHDAANEAYLKWLEAGARLAGGAG